MLYFYNIFWSAPRKRFFNDYSLAGKEIGNANNLLHGVYRISQLCSNDSNKDRGMLGSRFMSELSARLRIYLNGEFDFYIEADLLILSTRA